ncbi:MAG TPA: acyl carrier protein [bacterium]|nr:acyl carrier protein [bacterium]
MSTSKDEIFQKIRDCLVQALGVDPDEIAMTSSLTKDLGAESIDYLDIVFRLEKTFKIKIPRGDLFPESLLTSDENVKDGKMTPAGLAKLKDKMPYAELSEFEKNPVISNFANLFTVEMLVNYVADKTNVPA